MTSAALIAWGEDGVQQVVEPVGRDALQRGLLVDHALAQHFHRDAHHGRAGALAVARLQHPQPPFLDRELQVLHVLEVVLQRGLGVQQLLVDLRHQLFQRGVVGAALGLADQRQLGPAARADQRHLLRRADAGHHVFALRVDEEFAVEQVFAGAGVAGEGHAGGAAVAQVAEHHGLHVDRRAPALRDVVEFAVDLARSLFQLSNTATTAPQSCSQGSVGKSRPMRARISALKRATSSFRSWRVEFGVELDALLAP
jgi:hypothetical protein